MLIFCNNILGVLIYYLHSSNTSEPKNDDEDSNSKPICCVSVRAQYLKPSGGTLISDEVNFSPIGWKSSKATSISLDKK
jgi:hypothetical protein